VFPYFSTESRNVCLGICTDELNPFRSSVALYFCWPVIFTVYNLSPGMCMRPKFMFLSTVILSPNRPGRNIDVCLQWLIDELTQLWSSRTLTYDVSTKQNSFMKTTLIWTIYNFSTYEMVSGWSTHEKLACPYCMENNKVFTLTNGSKTSFLDCYQRFLPTNHMYINNFFVSKVEKDVAPRIFWVKNCITWCQSTVTLCLVSNLISRKFLVLV